MLGSMLGFDPVAVCPRAADHGSVDVASSRGKRELSQTSREVVESSYDAWRRRDADAATRLCHAHVELHLDDRPTVYRGQRGIREAFERELDCWEWIELELDQLIDRGDEFLGLATFHGRGHGSGIEVEHFIGHLWTVDAGLLARIQIFHDRNRALAAIEAGSTRDAIPDRMDRR
jgi:ketosteroid isomerase-like protein